MRIVCSPEDEDETRRRAIGFDYLGVNLSQDEKKDFYQQNEKTEICEGESERMENETPRENIMVHFRVYIIS